MWSISLPVFIKTAIQVVSGGWIFFKFKMADNDDASSCSSDSKDLKF